MLGLPETSNVRRQLPKKAIFDKFDLKPSQRDSFDADVSRLDIVNWISPKTVPSIAEGTEVKEFYVVEVALKRKDFDEHHIALFGSVLRLKGAIPHPFPVVSVVVLKQAFIFNFPYRILASNQ